MYAKTHQIYINLFKCSNVVHLCRLGSGVPLTQSSIALHTLRTVSLSGLLPLYTHTSLLSCTYVPALLSNSSAHTLLLVLRNIWRKVLKSLSPLPSRVSMSLPICSLLPCCSLTTWASRGLINPPAASSKPSLRPVLIETLSLRSPHRETKASLFQGLMG